MQNAAKLIDILHDVQRFAIRAASNTVRMGLDSAISQQNLQICSQKPVHLGNHNLKTGFLGIWDCHEWTKLSNSSNAASPDSWFGNSSICYRSRLQFIQGWSWTEAILLPPQPPLAADRINSPMKLLKVDRGAGGRGREEFVCQMRAFT